ncbi:hypothetical protein B0H14DRAFT_2963662, partial [Mycena olivaceomarginata]
MLTFAATFEGLGPDVLLVILSLSDVYTVLSVSLVNRQLRAISMSKQLWISLVNDLRMRSFIETPPSALSQYATKQLLAKPVPDLNLVKVHLINGGRHFILGSNAALEIWGVIAKRCVWSRDGSGRTVSVGLAIEEHTLTMTILNESCWGFKSNIVGNLVVVNLVSGILLVDWRARMYIALNGFEGSGRRVLGLIPGHIVVVIHHYLSIHLHGRTASRPILFATFGSAWRPVSELDNPTYLAVTQFSPKVFDTPLLDSPPIGQTYFCTIRDTEFRWTSSGSVLAISSLSPYRH